ncbi:MAG: sensor histidine kinase [Gammaproteobacteria bacterium]|nr:sensor histidine kinase [Gammaproteobacteria bacterium]
MKSIQSRLATGLLISLILVFLILWLAVSNNIQKLSENYIASRLEHDIETLLTAVSFDKENTLTINEKYINSIYNRPFSGHYYTIKHNKTLIRSRSLWDQNLTLPTTINKNYHRTIQNGPENQQLIILSGYFNKKNQDVIINIAEDLTPIIKDISQFKKYFATLSLFILIALLLIQFIVLRKGLKPLRKIHSELSELEKGNINKLTTEVPNELQSIVNEVNHLSLALHNRLKRSRNALGDLSHAIKKPLTMLQNLSDKNKGKFDPDTTEVLTNQISSIQNITDRILKRARIAGTSKLNSPFNINEDLPLLIKTVSTMYSDKNITITSDIPDKLEIQIDREDMLELLGNLLDNAWKWANSAINISIKQENNTIIIIEDDGPGANEEPLNELTHRGVRLDETVSGDGFGLAITSDIINDYSGSLSLSRSEKLGGFKAKILLPIKQVL